MESDSTEWEFTRINTGAEGVSRGAKSRGQPLQWTTVNVFGQGGGILSLRESERSLYAYVQLSLMSAGARRAAGGMLAAIRGRGCG